MFKLKLEQSRALYYLWVCATLRLDCSDPVAVRSLPLSMMAALRTLCRAHWSLEICGRGFWWFKQIVSVACEGSKLNDLEMAWCNVMTFIKCKDNQIFKSFVDLFSIGKTWTWERSLVFHDISYFKEILCCFSTNTVCMGIFWWGGDSIILIE